MFNAHYTASGSLIFYFDTIAQPTRYNVTFFYIVGKQLMDVSWTAIRQAISSRSLINARMVSIETSDPYIKDDVVY